MHIISSKPLSLSTLKSIVFEGSAIELSDEVIQKIQECRDYLNQKIEATSDPIYGINTGFGSLKTLQNYKKIWCVLMPVAQETLFHNPS
jgi:histidine ammonia-lyase